MQPTVLCYRLEDSKGTKLRMLCIKNKIKCIFVKPEQYLRPVGSFVGLCEGKRLQYTGGVLPSEMLVLANFSSTQLDSFLNALRQNKIPPIALKAVITPDNQSWNALELYDELKREHLAMQAYRGGFDTIISGGMVVDGSGSEPVCADVGILNGKIAAIGDLTGMSAKELFDASGKYVTPGFLDIHRHADAAAFREGFGELELMQGLTTIINGNCGLSVAPIEKAHEAEIKNYLAPITGVIGEEVPTDSLADYLDALSKRPLPIHVGMLAGNGIFRANAAGYGVERLNDEHYASIHAQIEQALQDGALGISLGLGYAPECFYETDELIRALSPLKDSGVPITVHMREEGDRVTEAVAEMIEVCRQLHTPVHISHLKAMGKRNWEKKIPQALALIEQARAEGLDITCDVYPYTAGSTQLMHILPPDFLTGGIEAVTKRLLDLEKRAELTERIKTGTDFDNIAQLVGWENILMSTLSKPENKPYEGLSIADTAKLKGIDPFDCCYDMLASEHCAITMIDFITCENDIAEILRKPYANVISDSTYPTEGQPHPRLYGTFTRVLEKYVREEKILTIGEAIARMTKLPADALGLNEKGRLEIGADADINVFSLENIHENATYADPKQLSSGMDTIFVGGVKAVSNGKLTGLRNGTVLKKELHHETLQTV